MLWIVYQENYWRYNNGKYSLKTLSLMAETFFLSYLWVQYIAVYFFVPFFLTGVISGEREQKTLDLLFTTQLGNREIIFGKLGSRVVSMVMLILSGVPIVAITMLFGGVNPQVFLYALISTMLAVLYTGATAIYFSTVTKTTLVLVRTYWWMMCWILIVPLVLTLAGELMMQGFFGSAMQTRMWWQSLLMIIICVTNPVAPFFVSVTDFISGRLQADLGSWYFLYMLILPTLWSILLIVLAILNVRRDPGPRKAAVAIRKVITAIGSILILKPITSRLLNKLPKTRADRCLWFSVSNPLWLRSRRAWVYDRDQHLQRAQLGGWILVLVALVLIVCLERGFFRHRESTMIFMMWIWLGLAVVANLVAGISIINDRRRGFFEFVLVTPLNHYEVIQGTFLACWRHIRKIYTLIIVMMIFFIATETISVGAAMLSVFMGTLFTILMVLTGIACSLVARSVAVALICTFSFGAIVLIFPPMFSELFRGETVSFLWILCFLLLPVSWLLTRWRRNAFTTTFFLIMMHFSIVCLFTGGVTSLKSDRSELPLMSIHPAVHTFVPLMDHQYSPPHQYAGIWQSVVVLYSAGLLVNIVWLFWYLCRHYEVLSGRHEPDRKSARNRMALGKPRSSPAT